MAVSLANVTMLVHIMYNVSPRLIGFPGFWGLNRDH